MKYYEYENAIVPATSKAQVARMFGQPVNGQTTTNIKEVNPPTTLVYFYNKETSTKQPIEELGHKPSPETVTVWPDGTGHDGEDVPVVEFGSKVPVKHGYFAIWDSEESEVFDLYYRTRLDKISHEGKYTIDHDTGDLTDYNWDKWL